MKIWITGDLHFNTTWFKYLLKQQNNYDILCLTGDLLDLTAGNFSEQSKWIANFLTNFSKPIFICSGNHDLDKNMEFNWLSGIGDNITLDNRIKTIEGVKFGVMPYLGADISRFYDCDILLHHIPPANTKTAKNRSKGSKDFGDDELYQVLKHKIITPKYLLCGHVEQPLNQTDQINKTTIINPGVTAGELELEVYSLVI